MKQELVRHPHIQIRKSPIHGYGIFATEDIPKDTVIEEVGFMEVQDGVLYDYVFLYPKFDTPDEEKVGVKQKFAIPHGLACLYNHSDGFNTSWKTDTRNELFIFYTIKDIKKGDELFIYYGNDSYWIHHQNVVKK
jgi:SET domain-containing protein